MPCGMIEVRLARQGVNAEQLIDPFHDARGDRVVGIELDRVEELPPRVRPASGMHQLWPAHAIVGGIAVGLQNSFELSQKFLRTFAPRPSRKSKTTPPPGRLYCQR